MSDKITVLHIPAWYPSPEQPHKGIFVQEHVKSTIKWTNAIVALFEIDNSIKKAVEITEERSDFGEIKLRVQYRRTLPGAGKIIYPYAFIKLMGYLKKRGLYPEIVQGHVYLVGAPLFLAKVIYGRRVVITEHFSRFVNQGLNWRHRIFANIIFKTADEVLPVSVVLEKAIKRYFPKIKTQVVPNVVDLSLFQPETSKKNLKQFIAIGSVIPSKGFDRIIEAFEKFTKKMPGFNLIIVGATPDPEYRRELEEQISQAGLRQQVIFKGLFEKDKVAEMLSLSTAHLVASKYETFGITLIESLASGVPVITTPVGIAPELMTSGVGGVFITKEDFGDADKLMAGAISEQPKIERGILDQYSLEKVGEKLLEVYKELLNKRR